MIDFPPDIVQEILIYPPFHIAEGDICMRALPGVQHLHMQVCAADSAPNHGCIGHKGLHEAVLGAPEGLVLLRLSHAPGRVCPGIYQQSLLIAIHQKHEYPGEQGCNQGIPFVLYVHFHIGRETFRKSVDVLWHLVRSQIHEVLQQLLHQIILAETVHQVHTGFLSAHLNDPVDDIKILLHIQDTVQVGHIILQRACETAASSFTSINELLCFPVGILLFYHL